MRQPSAHEVAEAVRAVLGARAPGAGASGPRVLTFPGRLLSARQVNELPAGTHAVRLAASTVLTPVARDLLRQRGISVLMSSDASGASRGSWGFCIEAGDGHGQSLRRSLLARDEVWHEVHGAKAAFDWVRGSADRLMVVATTHAALRVWQASQVTGVRPAQAFDALGLKRAVDDLAPNVLVLDMVSLSLWELLQLCRTFRRLGIPTTPCEEASDEDRRDRRQGHSGPAARELAGGSLADRAAVAARGLARGIGDAW
jgi:hypothetical protein